jgi:hypothetical protein
VTTSLYDLFIYIVGGIHRSARGLFELCSGCLVLFLCRLRCVERLLLDRHSYSSFAGIQLDGSWAVIRFPAASIINVSGPRPACSLSMDHVRSGPTIEPAAGPGYHRVCPRAGAFDNVFIRLHVKRLACCIRPSRGHWKFQHSIPVLVLWSQLSARLVIRILRQSTDSAAGRGVYLRASEPLLRSAPL